MKASTLTSRAPTGKVAAHLRPPSSLATPRAFPQASPPRQSSSRGRIARSWRLYGCFKL
ncbi:MAG: hypothetical protein QXT79_09610 [Thermofilaceae archaeon]